MDNLFLVRDIMDIVKMNGKNVGFFFFFSIDQEIAFDSGRRIKSFRL